MMSPSVEAVDLEDQARRAEAIARQVGVELARLYAQVHGRPMSRLPSLPSQQSQQALQVEPKLGHELKVDTAWWAFAKTDGTPVTLADHYADERLRSGIGAIRPGVPICSEETSVEQSEGLTNVATQNRRFWLIDPLDGTKEFLNGTDEFCSCIALIEAGRPILGLIHAPYTGISWWTWRGAGQVWRLGSAGDEQVLRKRKPQPADTHARLRIGASRQHSDEATRQWLMRYPQHEAIAMGSALKFCALAEGRLDIYPRLGTTMAWDTAAGQCIVEEAGGRVHGAVCGTPLTYNPGRLKNEGFIATFVVDV